MCVCMLTCVYVCMQVCTVHSGMWTHVEAGDHQQMSPPITLYLPLSNSLSLKENLHISWLVNEHHGSASLLTPFHVLCAPVKDEVAVTSFYVCVPSHLRSSHVHGMYFSN